MPMPPEHINRPIFIPTATGENSRDRISGIRTSLSASQVANGSQHGHGSRRTAPTISGYANPESLLRDAMDSLSLGVTLQTDIEVEASSHASRNQYRAKLKSRSSIDGRSENCLDGGLTPSAVNVKTGSSIFSLDVDSSSSPQLRLPTRGFRGSTRNVRTSPVPSSGGSKRQERSSRNSKTDEWFSTESDYASNLLNSGEEQQVMGSEEELDDNQGVISPEIYLEIAGQTISAGRFFKVAYPDMYGHVPPPYREPLHDKKFGVQRYIFFIIFVF